MVGRVIESRPGGVTPAALFFVLAAASVVGAVAGPNLHLAVLAALPLALGVAAVATLGAPVRFTVADDGLEFDLPEPVFVRYAEITGVAAPGRGKGKTRFPMHVYHPDGVVRIPARLNVPSDRLFEFLLDRLPEPPPPDPADVPGALRGFVADQLDLFGPEKVFVFQARQGTPPRSRRGATAYSLAVALAGLVWVGAGAVLSAIGAAGKGWEGWLGGGIALAVLGGMFALLFWLGDAGRRSRDQAGACLVVSPGGVAMVQGRLRGKLRWDELLAIDYPARAGYAGTTAHGVRGIGLRVAGSYMVVADYYNRPLTVIKAYIKDYWGGPDAN